MQKTKRQENSWILTNSQPLIELIDYKTIIYSCNLVIQSNTNSPTV